MSRVALLLASGFALVLSMTAAGEDRSTAEQIFAATDRNDDGHVDRREFAHRQVDVFYFNDDDKDGVLEPGEAHDLKAEHVSKADRNNDGKLQLEEFLEARSRDFDEADTDGDGVLTLIEVKIYGAP